MSRIFGAIYQNGYVVNDVLAAANHWITKLGVGPFFRFQVEFEYYEYRGQQSSPVLDVMIANSGDYQIELIQQINDAPSAYRDFLKSNGPGLQHLSVWTDSFDADAERYAKLGLEVSIKLKIKDVARAWFYDTGTPGMAGTQMEVLERTEAVRFSIDTIRVAAADWDGRDPIRSF